MSTDFKSKLSVLWIGLTVLALAMTTPSKSDFVEYASTGFHEQINDSEIANNQVASGIAKGMINLLLGYTVQENNYLIFKTFTIDMQLARAFNKNIDDLKFVGIVGKFIPLNKHIYNDFLSANGKKRSSYDEQTGFNEDVYRSNTPDINSRVGNESNLHSKTEIFIHEIFNGLSANNDVAIRVVEKYWAPEVLINGRKVNKNTLASEKIDFFQKWPLRNYISSPAMQEIECDGRNETCKVEGVVNWGLENYKGTRKIKGASEYAFTIDFSRETPQITEESMQQIQK